MVFLYNGRATVYGLGKKIVENISYRSLSRVHGYPYTCGDEVREEHEAGRIVVKQSVFAVHASQQHVWSFAKLINLDSSTHHTTDLHVANVLGFSECYYG